MVSDARQAPDFGVGSVRDRYQKSIDLLPHSGLDRWKWWLRAKPYDKYRFDSEVEPSLLSRVVQDSFFTLVQLSPLGVLIYQTAKLSGKKIPEGNWFPLFEWGGLPPTEMFD